ncbi:putative uracil phosphoribosyltransferase [Viridothelium virens]|uniref:uracil phosphoribosyltransferase n=1 Tax=Viridothelium virens TaxID=1048519 RepID=A0A6A6HLV4_VIRVR|nr:putative uracil phosphoribosyltransferase [Viridothelium virens]
MAADLPSNVHVSKHPCLRAKLSQLRSENTNARETKLLIHEIATIVACEALSESFDAVPHGVGRSPLGYDYNAETITPSHICLIPILRSGLGMIDALQSILPLPVPIHHLGLYRESSALGVVEYYNKLPDQKTRSSDPPTTPASAPTAPGPSHLAIIVDPVIATGATACAAIDTLRDWGVHRIVMISVIGSTEGLKKAGEKWAEGVQVWVGGMDEALDAKGMIKPGLGDVGDRLFLTAGR